MRLKYYLLAIFCVLMCACKAPKDVIYFQGIDDLTPDPGFFHFVATNKQCLNTTHGFQQQTFIGIRQMRLIKGF